MTTSVKLISNYDYKRLFLSGLSKDIMFDNSDLQLYRIENYLKNILIPVLPYRTTFSFILFVTQGHIRQHLDASEYLLTEGSVLIISQGNITATLELSDNVEGFFLAFENKIIEDIKLRNGAAYLKNRAAFRTLNPVQISWVRNLYELLEEELQVSNKEHLRTATLLFETLFSKLMQIDSNNSGEKGLSRKSLITFSFKELIQKYHIDYKDLQYYADYMSITENYLNKCIKEVTGKPAKTLLVETSILYSQILLQDLQKNVSDIAFELNYQSPSHFTSQFKKVVGMSPTTFRKKFCDFAP